MRWSCRLERANMRQDRIVDHVGYLLPAGYSLELGTEGPQTYGNK